MNKNVFYFFALLLAAAIFAWTVFLSFIFFGDDSPITMAIIVAQAIVLLFPYQIICWYFSSRIFKVKQ